jgi:hypothetical protein
LFCQGGRTDCHDITLVATDNFSNLASTGFEGDPGETLNR